MGWREEQIWEANWWGNCGNTLMEELKQYEAAARMGIGPLTTYKDKPYSIDLQGKSVLDLGGGPVSLLLKCYNFSRACVVDPGDYPSWVRARYDECRIDNYRAKAEDVILDGDFDEVWIYNVLQHVVDPEQVIQTAKRYGKVIRIHEWLEVGIHPGHPHNLTEENLNKWLGGKGKVEHNPQGEWKGISYTGVFTAE